MRHGIRATLRERVSTRIDIVANVGKEIARGLTAASDRECSVFNGVCRGHSCETQKQKENTHAHTRTSAEFQVHVQVMLTLQTRPNKIQAHNLKWAIRSLILEGLT